VPEREDWAALGLPPGAPAEEVHRAYRRRVALYSPDALATYSLLSDEERGELVSRIERAYRSIVGDDAELAARRLPPADASGAASIPSSLPPDPVATPGAYIRHHREALGLSLAQITARTKIRVPVLQAIEAEDFSALPADVYVRGFVVQIGRVLALPEPRSVAEHYLGRMRAAGR
jgi:hypothetical protein